MPTCRRHYPGGNAGGAKVVPPVSSRLRPSPSLCWVGYHITRFEACSAFTHVTACLLAESLKRPFPSKASTVSLPPLPLRLLPAGTTSCRVGFAPTEKSRLGTAHNRGRVPLCEAPFGPFRQWYPTCSVENPQLHRQLGRIMHYEHYNQIANCRGAAGFDRRSQDIARLCQPLQPQTLHTTPTLRLLDSQGLFQDRLPWHRPALTRPLGPPSGSSLDAHSAFHHTPKGQRTPAPTTPRPPASPRHRAAVSRPSPTGATSCL